MGPARGIDPNEPHILQGRRRIYAFSRCEKLSQKVSVLSLFYVASGFVCFEFVLRSITLHFIRCLLMCLSVLWNLTVETQGPKSQTGSCTPQVILLILNSRLWGGGGRRRVGPRNQNVGGTAESVIQ